MISGSNSALSGAKLSMRGFLVMGAFASVAAFAVHDAEARGPRGGGNFAGLNRGGAGGFSGFNRGGGGFSGFNRSGMAAVQRPSGASNGQRPSGQTMQSRTGAQGQRSATANTNTVNGGNRSTRTANGNTRVAGNGNGNVTNANSGVVGSGNGNSASNTGVVGSGNGNSGYAYNSGNVAVGNDVNVNVGNGNSGWSGYNGYAVGAGAAYATGVAVGTTATAAAVGSYYAALPAGCSPYYYSSYSYYACGGTWYQVRYQSGSTVYVVVSDPTKK